MVCGTTTSLREAPLYLISGSGTVSRTCDCPRESFDASQARPIYPVRLVLRRQITPCRPGQSLFFVSKIARTCTGMMKQIIPTPLVMATIVHLFRSDRSKTIFLACCGINMSNAVQIRIDRDNTLQTARRYPSRLLILSPSARPPSASSPQRHRLSMPVTLVCLLLDSRRLILH